MGDAPTHTRGGRLILASPWDWPIEGDGGGGGEPVAGAGVAILIAASGRQAGKGAASSRLLTASGCTRCACAPLPPADSPFPPTYVYARARCHGLRKAPTTRYCDSLPARNISLDGTTSEFFLTSTTVGFVFAYRDERERGERQKVVEKGREYVE